jgi:hypothetical protein
MPGHLESASTPSSAELEPAWNELRAKLAARASQLSDEINASVDEFSAKVDEVQAAWEARDE